jgi:hypothetical protein
MDAVLDNIVVSYGAGNVLVKDKSCGAAILNASAGSLSTRCQFQTGERRMRLSSTIRMWGTVPSPQFGTS